MMIISSKFILETVFEKVDIKYEYSDKSLWNEILYKFEKEENTKVSLAAKELFMTKSKKQKKHVHKHKK